MSSVRPPKCLLTSARCRNALTVASVCASVSWPPLRIHDVEIKLVGQPLVKLHRLGVEANACGGEVVGANHRGVARRVAATQISFLQYGNVRDAVILGEVISSRHTVPPATDDHHVVMRLEISGAWQIGELLERVIFIQTEFQQ